MGPGLVDRISLQIDKTSWESSPDQTKHSPRSDMATRAKTGRVTVTMAGVWWLEYK